MTHARTERKFRTMLGALREECPTAMGYPVQVRRRAQQHRLFGWAYLREDEHSFGIVLMTRTKDDNTGRERDVSAEELLSALIHEWAHVMSWSPEHHSLTDHDAIWGVNYAKCYQATIED